MQVRSNNITILLLVLLLGCSASTITQVARESIVEIRQMRDCTGSSHYDDKDETSGTEFCITDTVLLSLADVAKSEVGRDAETGGHTVILIFTPAGKDKFAQVTLANLNKMIAILVNGRLRATPRVMNKITSGRISIVNFSEVEAIEVVRRINAALGITV
jgi:preprotein translocase subunit SecD